MFSAWGFFLLRTASSPANSTTLWRYNWTFEQFIFTNMTATEADIQESLEKLSEEELAEYKEAFNIFDRDNSGSISPTELRIAMRSLGQNPSEEELVRMIAEVDIDGNSELDFNEFCYVMSRNKKGDRDYKAIEEAFKVFDKEGKGSIDRETFRHIMTTMGERLTDDEVDEMLDEADKDGDGNIDYLEFTQMLSL